MTLIALMYARIPQSPDNLKGVIEDQTFQTPFYSAFELVAKIVFSFVTNFGQRSIQSDQIVAIIMGN